MKVESLFVIVDPTQSSQPAFKRAVASAGETGAALHLYACVATPEAATEAQTQLDSLQSEALERHVPVTVELEQAADWAVHAVAAAKRFGASMVFKNSIDHSLVQREREKTSDWTLLRSAPCPVLLVKDFHNWEQRRVLAAINPLSPDADHARLDDAIIEFTVNLASSYGSEAHFVTAFSDLNHQPEAAELAVRCGAPEQQIHVRRGKPAEVIRDVGQELNVDLIVVGTVARDGIKGRVVGNTSERLLDQTHSDVMVLNLAGHVR